MAKEKTKKVEKVKKEVKKIEDEIKPKTNFIGEAYVEEPR